ncbi:MAG: DNA polymerase III subunit [Polyangiaceae bacterium]|nr:DNA polymerase III subunit [Polyangiaceae bacterium]
MSFAHVLGQAPALQTLERALTGGRVHHAYRFTGPDGVGKELAALALARALVCEAEDPLGCERCSACQRALTFASEPPQVPLHPDVVLVERGLYPANLLGISGTEATGISVEQIRRVVLTRVGYRPHEGRALVFIVRDADLLTTSAANSLLKTLEEPPPRTHFVLLTSRENRLLDTIRSRTLPVRFGPLPDDVIATLLRARGLDPEAARLAQGSARRALELADPERVEARAAMLAAVQAALDAPDITAALDFAQKRPEDRHALSAQLGELALHLAERARQSIARDPDAAERIARQHELVLSAMSRVERNVQAALVLESMLLEMRSV